MHHSQPITGGDDHAKPSVFKMISSVFLPCVIVADPLGCAIDTGHQPGAVLSFAAAKAHRVHPPRKDHGSIAIRARGTCTSWRREPRVSGRT